MNAVAATRGFVAVAREKRAALAALAVSWRDRTRAVRLAERRVTRERDSERTRARGGRARDAAGREGNARRGRAEERRRHVDKIAAAIMLQSWIDAGANGDAI